MCPCDHTSENGQSTRKRTETLIPQKKLLDRNLIFVNLPEAFHRKGNAHKNEEYRVPNIELIVNETWTSVGRDARTHVTIWRISAVNKLKKRSPRKKTFPCTFVSSSRKKAKIAEYHFATHWTDVRTRLLEVFLQYKLSSMKAVAKERRVPLDSEFCSLESHLSGQQRKAKISPVFLRF